MHDLATTDGSKSACIFTAPTLQQIPITARTLRMCSAHRACDFESYTYKCIGRYAQRCALARAILGSEGGLREGGVINRQSLLQRTAPVRRSRVRSMGLATDREEEVGELTERRHIFFDFFFRDLQCVGGSRERANMCAHLLQGRLLVALNDLSSNSYVAAALASASANRNLANPRSIPWAGLGSQQKRYHF